MKDIKDYLHLYLGCEAILEYPKGDWRLVDIITGCSKKLAYTSNEDTIPIDRIKPILRSLSYMTEEEKEYLVSLTLKNDYQNVYLKQAAITYFLISKHFDLFNLIESGLAIEQ